VANSLPSERAGGLSPPALALVRTIDTISDWSGRIVCWLIIPMVGGLTYEVIARYVFHAPTIWAYDTTYILYGTHFMLGAAYALFRGGHIRTDMLYSRWSPRRQGITDAICYLFFFFPGILLFLVFSWQEAWHAWLIDERSDASPWRPIIWPLKMAISISCFLLLLQGVAELLKSIYAARTGRLYSKRETIEI
jgi:TRAP-type mannitol/chloroaromatic compound transport system permease small subunit